MVHRRRRKALEQAQVPCTGTWARRNNGFVDPSWASRLSSLGPKPDPLPAPTKATSTLSVGYDVYDLWDLGEFNQKGSKPTKYGTKDELKKMIDAARDNGIVTYID